VIELGAGVTGLAGVALYRRACSELSIPLTVHLTDGNPECVGNLLEIAEMNSIAGNEALLTAGQLLWGGTEPAEGQYDLILTADCLYQTDLHNALIETIHLLIKPHGLVVICAPERKPSMACFREMLRKDGRLYDELVEWPTDEVIWRYGNDATNIYSADRHLPRLLLLARDERLLVNARRMFL
jgi:hypothetical protein